MNIMTIKKFEYIIMIESFMQNKQILGTFSNLLRDS